MEEFLKAFEIVAQELWKKEEMEVYDYIALKEMDEREALRTAEYKGMQQKARENALEMKNREYPVKDIVDITGLTEEEIENL